MAGRARANRAQGAVRSCLLATLAYACGPSGDSGAAPRVVLGTGEATFEAFSAGQTLTMAAGAQGGFHVWLSFRAYELLPDEGRLALQVEARRDAPGALDLATGGRVQVTPLEDGDPATLASEPRGTSVAFHGYPLPIDDARCAGGHPLWVRLTVTDERGASASDERTGVLALPETFRGAQCEN